MIINGDCIEVMAGMPENSVDAIVTDPPYGLEFMGKEWDRLWDKRAHDDSKRMGTSTVRNNPTLRAGPVAQLWHTQWATQALRVLKPGGYLLAFGGTRTYHRLVCGLEDAGFEIRDTICWLYGSGFPKNLDISKQIDKMAGAEREVVGQKIRGDVQSAKATGSTYAVAEANRNNKAIFGYGVENITAPATEAAKEWQGWGTALKPAFEPICVARKPLSEKNVALNLLKWGTGGMDIDGSRVEAPEGLIKGGCTKYGGVFGSGQSVTNPEGHPQGRWPANVILDEETAAMLDEQSGESKSPNAYSPSVNRADASMFGIGGVHHNKEFGDSGGASRFFYCAKASSKERGKGNNHPTCKPIKLMEYLIKLVSREGATILDPFAGSGSTILAAEALGRKCIAIEQSVEYCETMKGRCRQMVLT